MKTNMQKITGVLGALIGVITVLTPFHLVPVCSGLLELKTGKMVHMRCHYTGQAEVFVGIVIIVTSVLLLLAANSGTKKSLGKVLAVLGIVVILLPTKYGIGVCMSPMECHATAKVLYLLGGLLLLDGLVVHAEKESVLPHSPGGKEKVPVA